MTVFFKGLVAQKVKPAFNWWERQVGEESEMQHIRTVWQIGARGLV